MRRGRLERNRAFLRVADEIAAEFETKIYEELRDRGAEEFSSERIVDGITITYSGEAYKTLKNDYLTFCVDVDGLATPWGIKPFYLAISDRTARCITEMRTSAGPPTRRCTLAEIGLSV